MMELQQLVKALEPYDIQSKDIQEWETAFDLKSQAPVSSKKQYEEYHLGLFKSIKKHLMLGKTLPEIRKLLVLPPQYTSSAVSNTEYLIPTTADDNFIQPIIKQTSAVSSRKQYSADDTPSSTFIEEKHEEDEMITAEVFQTNQLENELNKIDYSMQLANSVRQELLTPPEQTSQPLSLKSEAKLVTVNDAELEKTLLQLQSNIERNEPSLNQNIKPIVEYQLEKLVQKQPTIEEALRQPDGNLQNTGLLILIDRLVNDKDDLSAQLTELSRYNTHLRKVNMLYETQLNENNHKIQELRDNLHQLQGQLKVSERIQLLDNKAKLQEQLIRLEADNSELEAELLKLEKLANQLEKKVDGQHNPNLFIGTWLEEAELKEIHYDTMGINIPDKRSRTFKLSKAPDRVYGAMAILETTYDYRTNTLWKRKESMAVEYFARASELKGELVVDYLLEGKSIAKATYIVNCTKQLN